MTPSGLAPGTPAGAYSLTDFENVNLFSGNLNFSLPLLTISGRGGARMTSRLTIDSQRWQLERDASQCDRSQETPPCELDNTCPDHPPITGQECGPYQIHYNPDDGGWTGLLPGYGPGVLQGRRSGSGGSGNLWEMALLRLTFTASDGTELELRDQLSGGQPHSISAAPRGTIFVSTDGSAATFISDTTIYDSYAKSSQYTLLLPSGYLALADGTRYRIDAGIITWMRDRNGNLITYTYDESHRVITIKDSLNRQVAISYANLTTVMYDELAYKGFGGAPRSIKVWHTSLSQALRAGYSIQTYGQLFPGLQQSEPSQSYNPNNVISAVELPDGRRYQLYYNSYRELARVELPTGGAIEYDYSGTITSQQISRRVTQRRVYSEGSTPELKQLYSVLVTGDVTSGFLSQVLVEQRDANDFLLSNERHYFYGSAEASLSHNAIAYTPWKEGREYQTEVLALDRITVLRSTTNTWQQRAAVGWWNGGADREPANDPRLVTTETTLTDTNQVSKKTSINPNDATDKGFDQFNNQTDIWEYDYGPGTAGSLIRHTHTNFISSTNYTAADSGPSLRGLPAQVSVFDANGIEHARTEFEYDNYGAGDNYHAAIQSYPRPGRSELPISGMDPAYTSQTSNLTRGNVTATTRYLFDDSGLATGSITAYAQYDIAGNVIKAIDPRSMPSSIIATTFDYTDRFGAPDAEAESNTALAELSTGGQFSYAFPTQTTNAANQSAFTQMDYYLGRAVDAEDTNGVTQSVYSENDPLDRPTKGIGAANLTSAKTQGLTLYDEANRMVTAKGDLNSFNDHALKTESRYDRLGRTIEVRTYEDATNYIAVQTQYDAMGRAYMLSNPFHPLHLLPDEPSWAVSEFDALGRVTRVTVPGGGVVTTSYLGNTVTVTDQAGRKRRSVTDALGRVVRVDEPDKDTGALDSNGTPVQSTSYDYDVLGNLVKVTQGNQQRYFMYDSLSRLIRSRNPEQGVNPALNLTDPITNNSQWSVGYAYDENGNLTSKTDPRGVVATYIYDALNRNTSVTYSNDPANTPAVTRTYDNPAQGANGLGRLWKTETAGVSRTTIASYDALGRPTSQDQQFYVNNAWTQSFTVGASYDKAGHLLTESYPSTHSITNTFDGAGRLQSFSGNLGDGGSTRSYSAGDIYSPFGGLTQEQFGTDTPLFNKRHYNVRGQLFDVRVSTQSLAQNEFDWNRGCLAFYYGGAPWGQSGSMNNGNLTMQQHWVPTSDPNTYSYTQDSYSYDWLNRLSSVTELANGTTPSFSQSYAYDRFGNRTISGASGNGINNAQSWIDPTTNRLYAPSDQNVSDPELRLIRYDAAGNQKVDYYSAGWNGTRTYDAENRMKSATDTSNNTSSYAYDGDGKRIKRIVNGTATWQVYGFGGELLAEYAANAAPATPQKEYGYRNGELLITADAPTGSQSSAQNVNWTSAAGVSISENTITKTASYGWGNAGAVSTQSIASGNGYVEFVASQLAVERICGLSHGDSSQSYEDIDFGILLSDGGYIYALESGAMKANAGAYAASDTLRVAIESGQVKYYKNGTLFYTSTSAPTYPLMVDSAINNSGASLNNVVISGAGAMNVALATNGATVTASSVYSSQAPAANANNGDHICSNGWWADGTSEAYPDWIQVDFNGSQTLNEIDVFGLQENYSSPVEPTLTMTSRYALSSFELQYWTGSAWATVPGGSVSGNDKVWKKFSFSPLTTNKIRVHVTNVSGDNHSQVVELEAWTAASGGGSSSAQIHWLVNDQLGTPRMVFDQSGSLTVTDQNGNYVSGVTRHDYLPFGEELDANVGGRTPQQGYTASDNVRQKFTEKERDNETGLDYFGARYFSSTQGRFSSVDPIMIKKDRLLDPQRINRYSYTRNEPLNYIDPTGADLVLAANLTKAQREFIVKNLARLFMTENGRKALERADRSPFKVVVGRAQLERKEVDPAKPGEVKFGGTEHIVGGVTTYDTVSDKGDKFLAASGPRGTESLHPITVAIDKDNSSDIGKDPAKVMGHEIGGHVNAALDLAERPDPTTGDMGFKITELDPKQDEKNAQAFEKTIGKVPDKPNEEAIKAVEKLLKPKDPK